MVKVKNTYYTYTSSKLAVKTMRSLKIKSPIWYILFAAVILAVLVYAGMIQPYIPLSQGAPIDAGYIDMNEFVGEKIPPGRFYATLWGELDYIEGLFFLFLGLVCFVLGLISLVNKLQSRQIFLISIFSVLFAFMSLSLTSFAAELTSDELRFYLYWVAFFAYPIVLLLHFFDCLRPKWRQWLWPPLCIAAVYGAAAFVMYFGFGLPFDIPERLFTYISAVSAVIYQCAGAFRAKDKGTAWYMRAILAFGIISGVRLLIMSRMGIAFSFHNEYKVYLLCVAAFMAFYTLFINVRELAGYKSKLHTMEIRNSFMLENYQALERHITQVARMKHEMRHHLFAIRELCEKGEYERLLKYLSDNHGEFAQVEESVACENRLIQAVLGHAARRARELGFEIEFDVSPLPVLSVSDADLVSLFMNLLDNALESCAALAEAKDRWITVRLKMRPPYLCLSVSNACGDTAGIAGDSYTSSKADPLLHGHGILIVRKIAEKLSGLASFEHTNKTFSAEVALPVEQGVLNQV
jgi:hypothetical protein